MTPETLLAEALLSLGDGYPIFRQSPTANDLGGETWWAHEPLAKAMFAASPTLRDAIALGLAWQRVEAALPAGVFWSNVDRLEAGYRATVAWGDGSNFGDDETATATADSPTAALVALAERLEARR